MTNRFIALIICVSILSSIAFFALWRNKSNQFENKCRELSMAEAQIESLRIDNEKLVEYNNKKDQQIKEIQDTYQKRLNSVPKDTCGDVKPSEELLEYLRRK